MFFSSRRRHTRCLSDWSSDVCSSDLVHSIEEHVPLSVLYKQFFAGELEVLCSLPEFFRKVSIVYSGGDDFAVYGSWDALIALAREVQRLFHRFTDRKSTRLNSSHLGNSYPFF